MLRGNYTVKMDEKGRIKLPAAYRRYVDEHYGPEFYVTSLTGECARLYPMQEWMAIEEKLQTRGTMDISVRKFLDRTNYYGQLTDMDSQGRILVHPLLRSGAGLVGDVAVLGYLQYLEVWELDRFKARMEMEPYTAEDAASLASLGV
ncbi:MAG TPA: division/cell wall cluster transcriptional repressor MraZ [Blastocatellia bacterium]|jgi:MraZ protein|nr:division/cell wall cluster transcriptional repressor MraZ [Blastocatellia bacterium]